MKKIVLYIFGNYLLLACSVFAETITVGQDGVMSFSVIQDGIDAAKDGDEVVVFPGTYFENIYFKGKNIVLRSSDPGNPAVVDRTIIDGLSSGSVVTFAGTEGTTCVLEGLTITNGSGTPDIVITIGAGIIFGDFQSFGGGVYGNGTSATLRNNFIRDNFTINRLPTHIVTFPTFSSIGCGVYQVHGLITNNRFENNRADDSRQQTTDGGALADCDGTIDSNTFKKNQTGLWRCDGLIRDNTFNFNEEYCMLGIGGDIHSNLFLNTDGPVIIGSTTGTVVGNFFVYNKGTAISHGGLVENNIVLNNERTLVWCHGIVQNNIIAFNKRPGLIRCNGTVRNNIIYDNTDDEDAAGIFDCKGTITNNIVWGNVSPTGLQINESSTPTYSCIQNWTGGGEGNISADPQLLDPDNFQFQLKANSPCIDTGKFITDLLTDIDGNLRPVDGDGLGAGIRGDGSDFDMGAYEFGVTSFTLQAYILGKYGLSIEQYVQFDLNGDSLVNIGDLIQNTN